mgnify:CR=1 FL=1
MPETTTPGPTLSLAELNNGSPFLTAAGLQVTEATGRLVVGTIELDNAPASVAVTPNGKKLYVTDQDTNLVYVYATATDTT